LQKALLKTTKTQNYFGLWKEGAKIQKPKFSQKQGWSVATPEGLGLAFD